MRNQLINILFYFLTILSFAQNSETIYPNFIGHTLNSIHNNSDWKILVKVEGDLDGDNLNDCVIVLESKDSIIEKRCNDCKSFQQKPRILLVLTFDDDKLQVIIQNNQFIARGNEGGMSPYIEPELTIDNGLLKIFYQYTRSNQSYWFKYLNNQMKIVYAESNYVHSASGNFENDKFDFINQKIISETGNISIEKIKTEIIEINVEPKLLSEFGLMYEWEIIKNKFI